MYGSENYSNARRCSSGDVGRLKAYAPIVKNTQTQQRSSSFDGHLPIDSNQFTNKIPNRSPSPKDIEKYTRRNSEDLTDFIEESIGRTLSEKQRGYTKEEIYKILYNLPIDTPRPTLMNYVKQAFIPSQDASSHSHIPTNLATSAPEIESQPRYITTKPYQRKKSAPDISFSIASSQLKPIGEVNDPDMIND